MPGKLVVITGTGTGIGKTHVAEALLLAWRAQGIRAAGLKPVESGVDGTAPSDSARLEAASTFHVKPFGYALRTPVAPHLAARREGVVLDLEPIRAAVASAREQTEVVLVELPGGLFSPFAEDSLNAEVAASFAADSVLLVAPDRLGVLHDVISTARAAAAVPVRIDAVILVAPELPDLSTGTNAGELRGRIGPPVVATLPRGSPDELALTLAGFAAALAR